MDGKEIRDNAYRNSIEYASEGWNPAAVVDDDQMYIDVLTGQKYHPCWFRQQLLKNQHQHHSEKEQRHQQENLQQQQQDNDNDNTGSNRGRHCSGDSGGRSGHGTTRTTVDSDHLHSNETKNETTNFAGGGGGGAAVIESMAKNVDNYCIHLDLGNGRRTRDFQYGEEQERHQQEEEEEEEEYEDEEIIVPDDDEDDEWDEWDDGDDDGYWWDG